MKFFVITTFINALACGSCCLVILLSNFKSKAAKSFALFNSTVAIWSFFYFLSMIANQPEEALIYSRILNTIALFIPPSFCYFCINLTENKNVFIRNSLKFFFIFDLLLLPFVGSKYFIPSIHHILFITFWPISGPLLHLSTIQYLILIPLSLELIRKRMIESNGPTKTQSRILYYSLLISFLGGSTNYFLCFNVLIPPFGNALIPTFVLGFMYLILKYQSMGIRISFSRSFVYTILIFLITFLYFIANFMANIYLNQVIGYKSFFFSLLAASITALAFIPLKDTLQIFIDKYFFKKSIKEIEQENKFLLQEVTQSDRMKSIAILASGMAHEIKNPLTPIKTFTEELPSRLDDKEFLLKFSKIINKEVDRIDTLVQDLLNFAKPSSPHLEATNICSLIEQILELLNNNLLKHKITINTSFENRNTVINVDQKQIKQILLNIFLNAIDAMPNGGTLTISTNTIASPSSGVIASEAKQSLTIEISDTGCGIDPKDIQHIFDPFFSKKDKGSGLGLAITQGIIENHGGTIKVKSRINEGTTFIIQI